MLGTALLAVAASLTVVGCGATGGNDGSVSAGDGTSRGPTSARTSAGTPGPPSSTPSSSGSSPGSLMSSGVPGGPRVLPHKVVAQGRVVAGVEAGCTLLVSGGTQYLLLGAPSLPEAGSVVRVEGHTVERQATHCMQGTPLHVDSLRVLSVRTP